MPGLVGLIGLQWESAKLSSSELSKAFGRDRQREFPKSSIGRTIWDQHMRLVWRDSEDDAKTCTRDPVGESERVPSLNGQHSWCHFCSSNHCSITFRIKRNRCTGIGISPSASTIGFYHRAFTIDFHHRPTLLDLRHWVVSLSTVWPAGRVCHSNAIRRCIHRLITPECSGAGVRSASLPVCIHQKLRGCLAAERTG